MAKTQTGMTDKPALEDKFNIQKYINGLAAFIKDCEVPMTIAVQGDWGTGKTSIMEMVRKELTGVKCVWFNTWQYSQFNMGDQLPLILLSSLLEKITEESGHTDAKETAKKALKTIFKMGMTVVSNVTNGATEGVENCLFSDGEEASLPESIGKLKDSFQNAINEICKSRNLDRIVVFVDDLDRLNPGKAVELLEVLKLFLDCDKCVFVLAIDYGVVSRGVSEKYGDLIGEEKGKSFFDKIIQVPFKMPVANYEIKN
jgi:predicted KAP-like P-loop ATPase